jgi:regulator of RNase E activity RraA
MNEDPLLESIRHHLFTAVIGDVMDAQGLTRQFLPPHLRAVAEGPILVGRAMTVQEADVKPDEPGEPFGAMFQALDDLKPGEVYVCTGSAGHFALWGELMSTRAMNLSAAGAVLDGFHRDTAGIRRLGFPVYSTGGYAQDQRNRGRVTSFRKPITFGNGTVVYPGDVIVGDPDGVLAIPAARLEPVVSASMAKAGAEGDIQKAIETGESTASVFARTGIM